MITPVASDMAKTVSRVERRALARVKIIILRFAKGAVERLCMSVISRARDLFKISMVDWVAIVAS